uniref:GBS Bsp-like repeat-containing protein n=1 Tax=uncultured Enterococcus sp. TaxID=167972 RepID=UPI0025E6F78C
LTTTHDVVGEAQKWQFQFASDGTYALYSTIGGYLEINDNQVVLTNELTANRQWTIKPIITTPVSDTQSSNETSSEMNTTTSTSEHDTTTSSSSLSSTIESTETEATQEKARSLTPLVNQVTTQEISQTQMKITIANPNGGNVSGVKFPTWSNTNGQDDIKWLEGTKESNGAYSVVVNSAEYRHSGLFNTHIYGVVNGKLVGLGTSQYTLAAPTSNTIVKTPISQTQMKITITNPNGGNVSGVKFPTWSNTNGQDDIKWLEGTKESNGAYSVVVNSAEYRHSGLFNTHIYGVVNGKLVGLGTSQYTLAAPASNTIVKTPISKTQMKITITNPNGGNVSGVKFPTWSNTHGQDDIKWLEGTKESNGAYSVVVNSAEYRHSGLFNTHIYGVVNGKLVGLATTSYTLTAPAKNALAVTPISKTQMRITIANPNGGNVSSVKFPTWSNANGQDDIKWLEGKKESNGAYSVVVDSLDYRHGGVYTTHVYGVVNGKLVGLATTSYTLEQDEVAVRNKQKPYYYSQLDPRWKNRRYGMSTLGPSGCVPSSMAMVLKGSYGINVTPVDTANRIYSYGGFNQKYFGASGPDLIQGMRSYGRQAVVMNSLADLNNHLAKGYPVIMYVDVGIGHAIVAHGYANGKTTIYDPYGQKFYKGQVSTSHLWSVPSQDYIDWAAGRPFFAIK